MSDRFESREDVAGKVGWEGGIWEALDSGLKSTDMPEGDDELIAAWEALENAYSVADAAADKVMDLLPEVEGV